MTLLFTLLLVYQAKHFLADYPGQTPWMLGKFKEKGWVAPLAVHAAVHAAMTFGIALTASGSSSLAFALASVDFVAHFAMDRVKASPKLLGRWKALTAEQYVALTMVQPAFDGEWYHYKNAQKRIRSNRNFWWALGFDQMVHHLTHYFIIYMIMVAR